MDIERTITPEEGEYYVALLSWCSVEMLADDGFIKLLAGHCCDWLLLVCVNELELLSLVKLISI